MKLSVERLLAFGARLSVYSDNVSCMEPARVRDALVRRLARVGLGRLPVPKLFGRVVITLVSVPTGLAGKALRALPPLLWTYNIARNDLLPYKVDSTFLATGRTAEAVVYCQDFLARHPNADGASLLLIDLLMATDRIDEAVRLAGAMSRECRSAEGLYGAGRRLMGLIAADDMLRTTASTDMQKAVAALNRTLQESESYRSVAMRCLDQAIARSAPDDALHQKARYWRGVLHFQQGDLDPAEADFRAVVASGQRYVFAYALLADILERRGQLHGAIELLNGVHKKLQLSLPIVERLVRLRLAVGDMRGALDAAGHQPKELRVHIVADVR